MSMRSLRVSVVGLLAGLALVGCSDNRCRLGDPEACGGASAARVCEDVEGVDGLGEGEGLCFEPVQLEGKVFDLASNAALAGAEVTALDVNGAPASGVARTDAQGLYVLRVPTVRTGEEGAPVGKKVTLRAAAKDHVPFPAGLRPSLPIDTAAAARAEGKDSGPYVVRGQLTDVGLSPVPDAEKGRVTVSGRLSPAPAAGALVVGETGSGTGRTVVTAVADRAGGFTLFNVPAGSLAVSAYGQGVNYAPATVGVQAADVKDVVLQQREGGLATVTGSISIVAGSGQTSVVLVPEATFNAGLGRGEVPPGLRAPPPPGAPSLTGGFTIEGVPPGRYAVLAAFENDGLVRDPDPNINGTDLVLVDVAAPTTAAGQFKVTSAVSLVGPGAGDTPEVITTATPTLTWAPYSNADAYRVVVLDALGREVWRRDNLPRVTGSNNTLVYAGPALTPGAIYQWRVTALRQGERTSLSEDLKGVFQLATP
jgi:hypothetical protein